MKIAYVSNTKNLDSKGISFNTEFYVGETLKQLGHDVEYIQEDTIEFGTLPSRVKGADMFLFTRTFPDKVLHADLRAIESMGIPTVSFHLDAYALIKRDGGMGIKSPFWDTQFVFSPENSIQARKVFKEHGINQFYLPPGVFKDDCKIVESDNYKGTEIVFVGGGKEYQHPEWDYRKELITWLENTYGSRFVKYGWPEKTVRGNELNELYNNSKIVIGDSLNKDFIDSWYWSDRWSESLGRNSFMIHPYVPGITDFLVDRKEIVLYGYNNWVQLKNLIDYYLEHDDEREAIRKAGHERVKRDHTYHNRMQQMLRILKEEGAIK